MKTQLLSDLQQLQEKALSYFNDATNDASEHGAGYLYISRKIHKIIGSLTGSNTAKNSSVRSLQEIKALILSETKQYGDQYLFELRAKLGTNNVLCFDCEVHGIAFKDNVPSYERYKSVYSKSDVDILVAEVVEIIKQDIEKRKELPEQDVVVK